MKDKTETLLTEFETLWQDAEALWETHSEEPEYGNYVSADFREIFDKLVELRGTVHTVLEWGSGLGVITIMASRLGFDAYGIECEERLLEQAKKYAQQYGADAHFALGNFIPEEFQWDLESYAEVEGTRSEGIERAGIAAYDELQMELRDFDLVYAFPWPSEQNLYRRIVKECGADNAIVMLYDAREGLQITRNDRR